MNGYYTADASPNDVTAAIRKHASHWDEADLIQRYARDEGIWETTRDGALHDYDILPMLLTLASAVEAATTNSPEATAVLTAIRRLRATVPGDVKPGEYVWESKYVLVPVDDLLSRFAECERTEWVRAMLGWVLVGYRRTGDEEPFVTFGDCDPPEHVVAAFELQRARERLEQAASAARHTA